MRELSVRTRATLILLLVAAVSCVGCGDDGGTSDAGASGDASAVEGSTAADGTGPACEAVAPTLSSLRLTPIGTELRDELGRLVLLRGANTGGRSKFPPFHPFPFSESGLGEQESSPAFNDAVTQYFARMASWGLNVARMPFTWEALEPVRDEFDEAFLDRYVAQIEAAGAHGIHVIVDYHQDVYARPFCGDGFPLWTIAEPIPETPDDCTTWFMGYFFDDGQKAAFDRFWANEDGLRDEFKDMWQHMVERTRDLPNVIGFEIINEPGAGSADDTVWGPEVLTPFYTEMGAHIRSHDDDALVFFDSTGLDAVTQETAVELPDGDGWVFAPHFYDPTAFLGDAAGGDFDVAESLGRWAAKRDEWGVPLIVGEFGIEAVDPGAVAYITDNFDAMDVFQLHGTVWEYSTTVDDWNDEGMSIVGPDGEDTQVVDAIVRAYPTAVDGDLTAWTWDPATLDGELTYAATADGVTEIAVPTRLYPGGVEVTIVGVDGCWALDEARERAVIRVLGAGEVTVMIGPATK